MGSLKDLARADIKAITTDANGWADELTFIAPDDTTVTINALHKKINLALNMQTGDAVNSKTATATFNEEELATAGYVDIRNDDGEVNLDGHRINVKDSTGIVKNYISKQWFPDETLGIIVVILDDYEQD